ncbi:serine/threonine protein kinase with PASTA sensor(s) [Desulfofarcimen acetoxidans DSM 771]|uniref:non-specific serine/threonine protein kinase n=1 Tax=Desulfofarcimen acetoxidans (strain ATCC 49208 / DSM 771 / KCTC 5769 / VKM B-1644 / 5575) TaxID=485916 RepID=C8VZY9_DESAS|nr:Stk1 family PASTA domain-containing Ser/Thr kinase [Desulfofarcimen acetoxidans]ACV63117.1 serine/threonine protein kinase with PASTA sensor(s) [Desulfofarcimen acetoxidans DSM 771]
MIGKRLGDRFEIIEQLGGGGMAVVYKGRDTLLHRLVTIKVLRPEFASDEEFVKSFRREARAIASLSHPNIVNIHDVGQEDHIQYLVMEYIDGDNLKNLIKKMGALSTHQAVQIALQVCAALEHAHENNIVHRDVKPHNILITNNGKAKLTDFGIAAETTAATMTHTDTIVGSVHYLSPEQAQGEEAGSKSDIYSLGVVLYEMLTGTLPFTGDNPIAIALKHIKDVPVPLRNIKPDISNKLQDVVLKAISKNPEHRQSSARELALELQAAETTLPAKTGDLDATLIIPVDDFNTRLIPVTKVRSTGAKDSGENHNSVITSQNKSKRPLTWVAVILVLIGLAIGGTLVFRNILTVPDVTLIDVTNDTANEAITRLNQAGFPDVRTEEKYDLKEKGKVVSQNPAPNTIVKKGRTILLYISKGPEMKTVPNLLGKSRQEASIEISNKGFVMAESDPVFSSDIEKDKVAVQSPLANQTAAMGSKISVSFSKGPQIITHEMPNLIGKNLDEAQSQLQQLKLNSTDGITRQSSDQYLPDQVITQTPTQGSSVQEGSSVSLVVSNGPGPTPKDATVEFKVTNDGKEHNVRIQVTDIRGTKEPYNAVHASGEAVSKTVRYYGKANIIVYIDDINVFEKSMD